MAKAPTKPSTDIVVGNREENMNVVPAYLQGTNANLDDNFDATDVVLPRIKLLQGLSPEIEDFPTDAKIGHFWHSGFDMDLGPEVKFIVCGRRKKFLLSTPMIDDQGILARADDGATWDRMGEWTVKIDKKRTATWRITDLNVAKSGLAEWGSFDPEDDNSPPAATMFYDYLVLLADHLELGPVMISLSRSAIRPAKKGLNDKISLHASANRPMQSLIFKASSTNETNPDGQDYKGWKFTSAGFVQSETVFNEAVEYGRMMATFRVADEMADDTAVSSGADTGTKEF